MIDIAVLPSLVKCELCEDLPAMGLLTDLRPQRHEVNGVFGCQNGHEKYVFIQETQVGIRRGK